MSEAMTEREAALTARIAELEAAAAKKSKPGGNIVEQIWHYLSYFVPPSLMIAGALVFALFHAWEYYNSTLKTAAETRIKTATSSIKSAEARANLADVEGVKLGIARVRAELELKKQQAAKAQAESDALNKKVEGTTLEVQRVQTEVQTKQLQAQAARIEADKLMQKAGLKPLASKLEETKLALEEFDAASEHASADMQEAYNRNTRWGPGAFIKSWCSSKFAKQIGCAEFVKSQPHDMQVLEANTDWVQCENDYTGKQKCVTLRKLNRDEVVRVIGDPQDGYRLVEATYNGESARGWVSSSKLREYQVRR